VSSRRARHVLTQQQELTNLPSLSCPSLLHLSRRTTRRVPSHEAPYVDEWGEEDDGLERGRPLTLVSERYRALGEAYVNCNLARKVTRLREGSDQIFREQWW
jgi:hypothetical protein